METGHCFGGCLVEFQVVQSSGSRRKVSSRSPAGIDVAHAGNVETQHR